MVEIDVIRKGSLVFGITKANKAKFTPLGLTVSLTSGVTDLEVQTCRNIVSKELGFESSNTHWQKQVHGTSIKHIPTVLDNNSQTDGMYTHHRKNLLCISVADCAGVVIWNKDYTIIGAAHSGWKGTQLDITSKLIQTMQSTLAIPTTDLCAWISPCASGESYLVRSDVQKHFPHYCKQISDDQFMFHNKHAIRDQLLKAGLSESAITISSEDTIRQTDYHSHRRDGEYAGRMAVFIGLE